MDKDDNIECARMRKDDQKNHFGIPELITVWGRLEMTNSSWGTPRVLTPRAAKASLRERTSVLL